MRFSPPRRRQGPEPVVDRPVPRCDGQPVNLGSLACSLASCVLAFTTVACQATTDAPESTEGCNATLEFRDTTYAFHPDAAASPPTGGDLEGADVLGCDGEVVDSAIPVRIEGVPVEVAVAVIDDWPGVYVVEGSDPST